VISAHLTLLGSFELEADGHVLDIPSGLQRLVAGLALGVVSHRRHVAGLIWPDSTERTAMASLRTSVWRLNRMAPGLIQVDGPGLLLGGHVAVDARHQEVFATHALSGDLRSADEVRAGVATLCAPMLLPGWYDDWVLDERERLTQLRLHALEACARILLELGDTGTAVRLALQAVHDSPLRESAQATLIAVYLAEGNLSDARHQYDAFTRKLGAELGLRPSRRLLRLMASGTGTAARRQEAGQPSYGGPPASSARASRRPSTR
jgi:DNA-binding SARP family transcriptional activator